IERVLARDRKSEDATQNGRNDRIFLVHLGGAYAALGRFRESADAFERARAVGGEAEPGLVVQHVEALVQAKDLPKALSEVRAARAKLPDDPDLAMAEAGVLREQGQLAPALQIVEALRRKSPQD